MNIVIVGAGPCGIMSAIRTKHLHPDYDVTLIEKNDYIGQRIKVSGNGRCNFSNTNFGPNKYNHPEFIVGYNKELDIFKQYLSDTGFYYYSDNEGRMYPHSETSASFIYILDSLLKKYKVNVQLNSCVSKIKKENDKYIVITNNNVYYADKIVLSIGGVSLNNDINLYKNVVLSFTNNITKLSASLTPISTNDFNKHLEGKRAKANVKLFYKDNLLKEERGEVLFKKNGVSGIVIFNMSSYLSRLHLSSYQNYYLVIDFLPDLTYEEVNKYYQIDPTLKNLLQEDIAYEISSKHLDPKAYSLEIHNLYDLKNSQVTSGGVSLNEINLDLSLKSDKNVYLGGEMIDIDGECGGYNIEFALLSGIRIGNVI